MKRKRAKPDRTAAVLALHTRLLRHSQAAARDEATHSIIIHGYEALEQLRAGHLDERGYWNLLEITTFGYLLATRLAQFSTTPDTVELLETVEAPLADAAELLPQIAKRHEVEGRWRFGQTELDCVREAIRLTEELMKVSTQGHTMTALMQTMHLFQEHARV